MSQRSRLAHVAGVLGRVFLSEAAYGVGIRRERSGDDLSDHARQRALMVRHALEQLGPFYIKVGQMLSTRPDLVSDSMIQEFEKLHDHVSVADFGVFEPVLEEELGRNWRRYFKTIDYNVLGAASLAQVYHVTLATGEPAVVKIQRPGIVPVMLEDMALTRRAAKLVARRAPDFNDVMDIEAILELIFNAMEAELDFTVEAENASQCRRSCSRRRRSSSRRWRPGRRSGRSTGTTSSVASARSSAASCSRSCTRATSPSGCSTPTRTRATSSSSRAERRTSSTGAWSAASTSRPAWPSRW
jgi:predicted unusual protein kinase regulating ubiquinone biosynthesis (AarF/ABC1/UbiB family)